VARQLVTYYLNWRLTPGLHPLAKILVKPNSRTVLQALSTHLGTSSSKNNILLGIVLWLWALQVRCPSFLSGWMRARAQEV